MTEEASFFRREALDSVNTAIGKPLSASGSPSWIITALLASVVFVVGAFMTAADYARRETVQGTLIPATGAVNVTPSNSGTISAIFVAEGQEVHAGQKLLAISTDPVIADGNSVSDLLSAATERELTATSVQSAAQIEEVRRQEQDILAQQAGLDDEYKRLSADLSLQSERVKLASETAEASRQIYEKGFLSAVTFRAREEEVLAAKQGLSAIRGQLTSNRTRSAQLVATRAQAEASLRRMQAENEIARAGLAEKRTQVARGRSVILTAGCDGRVAGLVARLGVAVRPQQALAVVLPKGSALTAELWVPSRAIGFIRPGDPVRLMLDSFPYQRFGAQRGKVSYVSRVAMDPQDVPSPPNQPAEPLFRVLVVVDRPSVNAYGNSWTLSPGMRLSADIVLEHRSMLEWLLDPLRAVRRRGTPA